MMQEHEFFGMYANLPIIERTKSIEHITGIPGQSIRDLYHEMKGLRDRQMQILDSATKYFKPYERR